MNIEFSLCLVLACVVSIAAELVTIDGTLVRVIDNCTVGRDDTCPAGQCCTKDGLMYIPEYTGPRPSYVIRCSPYRQSGESCYEYEGICPCDPSASLTCVKVGRGFMGHCQ